VNSRYTIIFMGTPDFAVPALQALIQNGHEVPLVVTQPDRPKGRGRKPVAPPLKTKALELGLKVLQPSTLRDEKFRRRIRKLQPDFFVVVAFGHIISENILQIPRLGTINIHASLLPKYRGPSPIQWAIINGESETGVTTMLMDRGIDTGDILFTQKEPIFPEDTAASLHGRLSLGGADLLIKTLQAYASETIKPIPQDHHKATYAPLLKKQDGHIHWQNSADELDAFIRGMTPWPGAFTFHLKNRLKILKATPMPENIEKPPGTILKTFPDELWVATAKGALSILEIQGPSGKRLPIADFLRGYQLPAGTLLK
jgi:methionyl-tRNA formyltransferase